ncbi:MAG: helix-turn-helix transcriptional regulator [Pseudonocardiaceae bacterium]
MSQHVRGGQKVCVVAKSGGRERLAKLRKGAGYTQQTLAIEGLKVHRRTVVRWERGSADPQPGLRKRLAEVLGISAEELADVPHAMPHISGVDLGSSPAAVVEPASGMHALVGRLPRHQPRERRGPVPRSCCGPAAVSTTSASVSPTGRCPEDVRVVVPAWRQDLVLPVGFLVTSGLPCPACRSEHAARTSAEPRSTGSRADPRRGRDDPGVRSPTWCVTSPPHSPTITRSSCWSW